MTSWYVVVDSFSCRRRDGSVKACRCVCGESGHAIRDCARDIGGDNRGAGLLLSDHFSDGQEV